MSDKNELLDLVAGVELSKVWDVPEKCEDDNWHHIDCARQTGEPAKVFEPLNLQRLEI